MNVERLSRKDQAEVVSVLMKAFHDYAVMRFVLRDSGDQYEEHLEALVNFFSEIRFLRNWPVLGIRKEGHLVAAALVNEPVKKLLPLPSEPLNDLKAAINDSAYQRLVIYEEKSSVGEPEKPHHFLGMIGVLPEYQGKGFASVLLNAIQEMSDKDPASSGVCLSTEDPKNVPIYEHFGFKTIYESDIEDLHSWCMFSPSH